MLVVKENQTRFTSIDDKILYLYSKGMTTRDIIATYEEMYYADVSVTLISDVTSAVIEQASKKWTMHKRNLKWP